ncbi:hypothetical protein QYF61_019670 [Mycteria americana]|uniref:Uncharacterized protein n=1 Tax=Mycteria americana TaxID=33587 RepID=A0AAN7NF35_MYCAM|nr:hypothetical protein QYF61_019670 [Mycteria americana]
MSRGTVSNALHKSRYPALPELCGMYHMPKGMGWRLNHFPGQSVPMLDNPLGEEKFPNIQSKPPLAQLEAISSCPITCYLGEETDPHLSTTSFQAKQSQLPQPLLIRLLLQTLHQLRCPSLYALQYLNIPLVVGGPKLNTVFEEAYRNTTRSARGAVLKRSSERLPVSLQHRSLCIAPVEAHQAIDPTVQSCQSHKQGRLDQVQCDPEMEVTGIVYNTQDPERRDGEFGSHLRKQKQCCLAREATSVANVPGFFTRWPSVHVAEQHGRAWTGLLRNRGYLRGVLQPPRLLLPQGSPEPDLTPSERAWKAEYRQAPPSGTQQAELVQQEGGRPPSGEPRHYGSPGDCPKEGNSARAYPACLRELKLTFCSNFNWLLCLKAPFPKLLSGLKLMQLAGKEEERCRVKSPERRGLIIFQEATKPCRGRPNSAIEKVEVRVRDMGLAGRLLRGTEAIKMPRGGEPRRRAKEESQGRGHEGISRSAADTAAAGDRFTFMVPCWAGVQPSLGQQGSIIHNSDLGRQTPSLRMSSSVRPSVVPPPPLLPQLYMLSMTPYGRQSVQRDGATVRLAMRESRRENLQKSCPLTAVDVIAQQRHSRHCRCRLGLISVQKPRSAKRRCLCGTRAPLGFTHTSHDPSQPRQKMSCTHETNPFQAVCSASISSLASRQSGVTSTAATYFIISPDSHLTERTNILSAQGKPIKKSRTPAKQPQLPQPLLIRLVLQTLHQLRCPSLDTLQPLNIPLVVRGPKLNTAFEVRPHQCRVQGHHHFPSPAGHTISDTSQDAVGFLGHLGTLLAHIQPGIDQHPQVLFHWSAFQPLFPKPVALHGVAVAQVQAPALGLVKPHTIDLGPSIQPVQVPLQSLPTLKQINTPTQFRVICKLTEGALDPLIQIIDKDIKQDWPQY